MAFGHRLPHAAFIVLAIVLAGCSEDGSHPLPAQPAPQPGFTADSPVNAVRLLEWGLKYRNLDQLSALFSDDFLFGCATSDSGGNPFQGHGLTRQDLLESLRHFLVGGGAVPPASSIQFVLDRNLFPQQDGRPGKQDPNHYQEIVTLVVFRIDTADESFQVTGGARLHLVRGDVAMIPAELAAHGAGPDPGRWYIEHWEDETVGSASPASAAREARAAPPPRTMPAKNTSLCSILALYR